MDYSPLSQNFFDRSADIVAEELLGKSLVRNLVDGNIRAGMIVETEAYMGTLDMAAHSYKGCTNRTKILFGVAGISYIYLIYGLHSLVNVTTGPEGSGVLIRALEPIEGIKLRSNGPGLLSKALGITFEHTGINLTSLKSEIFIAKEGCDQPEITITSRIGVDYAKEWKDAPLRFFLTGNPFVSRSN